MPGIMNIPPSYPPAPYQSKMPQLIQSIMMQYMQNKYATDRQKKEWDRRDKEAEAQRKFESGQTEAKAKLGKLKYLADMRKDHIKLSGPELPDSMKDKYEQGDVIPGLNNETYWVKRKEKKPVKFHMITAEGIKETEAQETGVIKRLKEEGWKRGSITPPADKETWGEPKWNKKLNAVTITNKSGDMKVFGQKGWKPATEAQYMKGKELGAARISIAGEKLDIEKGRTVAGMRSSLTKEKSNKTVYGAESPQFNTMNKQNEVAYWYTGKGWDGTKIIKLSKRNIDLKWTPRDIQEKADLTGMTVEEVLKEIGEL